MNTSINTDFHSEISEEKYVASLAPVVIFAYNRFDHLKKVIEALAKNEYADSTNVFVVSDGPKNDDDSIKIAQIRDFLKSVNYFKTLNIIERKTNYGLAKNIIDGVTNVCRKYGKVIVLEDDIVTSRFFLRFMNDALLKYDNKHEVMAVGGYFPVRKLDKKNSCFFLPWATSWGWATWQRTWTQFERNPDKLIKEMNEQDIFRLNVYGNDKSKWKQVLLNKDNKLFTWAIFFDSLIIKNKGLVALCYPSVCKNIGFDGSGTNCGGTDVDGLKDIASEPINYFPDNVVEDISASRAFCKFAKKTSRSAFWYYLFRPKKALRRIVKIFRH